MSPRKGSHLAHGKDVESEIEEHPPGAPSGEGAGKAPPHPADRNEAVRTYLPVVRYHATALKLRVPSHIEMDDLVSSGIVGLLDALDRFDPSRGIRFRTFAEFRIRGP